jgi:hypothetical protein
MKHINEKNCLTDEQIMGYLDNALPAEELEKVELHLIQCADCLYEVAVLEKNLALFDKGQLPAPPEGFLECMIDKIRDASISLQQQYEMQRKMEKQSQGGSKVRKWLKSPFEKFKIEHRPLEPTFSTKTFDVDSLRTFYNENLIPLTLAQVHVTILPDNDQIILHFVDDGALDGLDVTLYQLSDANNESEAKQTITRKIRGNDVRFALSALGLTIYDLDMVAFKVKIEDGHIEGRL